MSSPRVFLQLCGLHGKLDINSSVNEGVFKFICQGCQCMRHIADNKQLGTSASAKVGRNRTVV